MLSLKICNLSSFIHSFKNNQNSSDESPRRELNLFK